jgi:plastocyanin
MRRGIQHWLVLGGGLALFALASLAPLGRQRGGVRPLQAAEPGQRSEGKGSAAGGVVSGRVRLNKPSGEPGDPSGVVVYLEGLMAKEASEASRPHPQVRQRDLQFVPSLSVVVQGTTVDFPNDDKVFHNVFSFSETAKFDLGLYKSGSSKSVTLHKAGVVNVYCNIHPEMISKIKVLDSTYFAIVGADGAFRIEQVPVGSYPVVAWQANGGEARSQVTVTAAGKTQVDLTLTQGRAELRHTRKDGTPYGRYK